MLACHISSNSRLHEDLAAIPRLHDVYWISGALRSTDQAGLQKGWNEMDAAPPASPCIFKPDRGEHVPSGKSLASSLALVLALGSAAYLASPGAAAAADLQHKLEHFHPVAADLNQLAESVSLSARLSCLL